MSNHRISVITPAYNAELFIGDAILSVLAQTHPYWELLVVDDGSTDDTADRVRQFHDARIRLIQQPNAGLPAARNTALDVATGNSVAFLDADDELLPNHLASVAKRFDESPHVAGLITDGYYFFEGRELARLSSRRRGPFPDGDIFGLIIESSDVMAPPVAVALRRSAIEDRELRFDPTLRIGEDWDFFARFAEQAPIGSIPEATCRYRIHEHNMTTTTHQASRDSDIANVRLKAIGMGRFAEQSPDVRAAVFYDLLIRRLRADPLRRRQALRLPEFHALPRKEQSRLLRLTARQALLDNGPGPDVSDLLKCAATVNPSDLSVHVLRLFYRCSPWLCSLVLRARARAEDRETARPPFAEILAASR